MNMEAWVLLTVIAVLVIFCIGYLIHENAKKAKQIDELFRIAFTERKGHAPAKVGTGQKHVSLSDRQKDAMDNQRRGS